MTRRSLTASAAAVAGALAAGVLTGPAGPASASSHGGPDVSLVAARPQVELTRFPGEPVLLDLGVHVLVETMNLEVHAKRRSYWLPIRAVRMGYTDGSYGEIPLPRGTVEDFRGLSDFVEVTVRDSSGRVVLERDEPWCPGNAATRALPHGNPANVFPLGCGGNPFTVGAVWGLPHGWSSSLTGWSSEPALLADGRYTATVRITPAYRRMFDIPAADARVTTRLTVRTEEFDGPGEPFPFRVAEARDAAAAGAAEAPRPAARPPARSAPPPPGTPLPDLKSLPAWGITVLSGGGEEPPPGEQPPVPPGPVVPGEELPVEGNFLAFAATVWNGGRTPLVVDGFRRRGRDVMDAHQYFYDREGQEVASARAGTFEWDERDGHHHWHFTDFAQYRLLDARQRLVVRSSKESFCLANTDAVDYTLPAANWRPGSTDLHTSCGAPTSIAVRQVLDVGSGDTYAQFLPGQSFDVTDLPNGTYWIEVVANPYSRLHEARKDNNRSLRRVVLGGTTGQRTVTVPPHGLVDDSSTGGVGLLQARLTPGQW